MPNFEAENFNFDCPSDERDTYAKWDEIMGNAFSWLQQAVMDGTLEPLRLRRDLPEWKEFFENHRAVQFHKDLFRQWDMLQRWTWCAEQAIWATNNSHADRNPLNVHDEVGYAAWVGLSADRPEYICGYEAWAFDCIRLLASAEPPKPLCEVKLPVALIPLEDPHNAIIVELQLDVLPHGAGAAVHDPRHACCSFPEDSFAESMQDALKAARALAFRGDQPRWVYVRWRVVGRDGVPIKEIKDRSAGGMAALHLLLALRMQIPDQGIIVLAACNAEGHLASVDGIAAKVQAVIGDPRFDTIVVHPDNEGKARAALGEAVERVRVEKATTLESLGKIRSWLVEQIKQYCDQLIIKLDHTPWSRRVSEIAVPVRVLKESARREPAPPGRPAEDDQRKEREPSRDYVDPEFAKLYEQPTRDKRQEEVPWEQERRRIRRAIVLGGPGGGKSFLTQSTAVSLARSLVHAVEKRQIELGLEPLVGKNGGEVSLPVHLTMSNFARESLGNPVAVILKLMQDEWGLKPCFLTWVNQRLCKDLTWMFLDGLDEVQQGKDHSNRNELLAKIDSQGWKTRVIVTCRTANWDRGLVRWPTLTEYELAPFNAVEVRRFVSRWYASDEARGVTLNQAIERNYPLRHAARTPLIATLLCLAHEGPRGMDVTQKTRRVNLYEHVIHSLVERKWNKFFSLDPGNPHIEAFVNFLTCIAEPLFKLHPAGNQFTYEELEVEVLKVAKRPYAWVRREEKSQFFEHLLAELLETGILVESGFSNKTKQYSFLHRSFLEYLVARNLALRSWNAIGPLIDKKSWHPAWQEVVILFAGLLDNPVLLLKLLADKSTDDDLRHRLCLAGRCLPELSPSGEQFYKTAANKGAGNNALLPDIAFAVVKHWGVIIFQSEKVRLSATWFGEFSHMNLALTAVGAIDGIGNVLLRYLDYDKVRATRALGIISIANSSEWLFGQLMRFLCVHDDDEDHGDDASRNASDALAGMVVSDSTGRFLVQITGLLSHAYSDVRRAAALTLGRVGASDPNEAIVNQLVELLHDPCPDVREAATDALGMMGFVAATNQAVQRLTACLLDSDDGVRVGAMHALAGMGSAAANDHTITEMVNLVRNPVKDKFHDFRAGRALGRLGADTGSKRILNEMIRLLEEPEPEVRRRAIQALEAMGDLAATEDVVDKLLALMHRSDWSWDIGLVIGHTLSAMGASAVTERFSDELVKLLRHPNANHREKALQVLRWMGAAGARDELLRELRNLLDQAEGEELVLVVNILAGAGKAAASSQIVTALTKLLDDPSLEVRTTLALALGKMGVTGAVDRISDILESSLLVSRRPAPQGRGDRETFWRGETNRLLPGITARALGEIGPAAATNRVLKLLVKMLRDSSRHDRWIVLEELGNMGQAAATGIVVTSMVESMRQVFSGMFGGNEGDEDYEDRREYGVEALKKFLRAGIRWFPQSRIPFFRPSRFRVAKVAELSA